MSAASNFWRASSGDLRPSSAASALFSAAGHSSFFRCGHPCIKNWCALSGPTISVLRLEPAFSHFSVNFFRWSATAGRRFGASEALIKEAISSRSGCSFWATSVRRPSKYYLSPKKPRIKRTITTAPTSHTMLFMVSPTVGLISDPVGSPRECRCPQLCSERRGSRAKSLPGPQVFFNRLGRRLLR